MIYYACDFETTGEKQYQIEGRTRVYLWCLKKLYDNKDYVFGYNCKSFINYTKQQNEECIFFFHNGSRFDLHFILYTLFEMELSAIYDLKELKENNFYIIMDEFKKIYEIVILSNYNKKIHFRCSYLLINQKIEKLGEMLGLKKLHETHNYDEIKTTINEEEIEYIKRDVEILEKSLEWFLQINKLNLTISGIAFNKWKSDNHFLYQDMQIANEEALRDIDLSYIGGIVQVNDKYIGKDLKQKIYGYDINSMYTAAMYKQLFPIGEPTFMSYEQFKNSTFKLGLFKIYINHVELIKEKFPFIPTRKKGYLNASYKYDKVIENKVICIWENMFDEFIKYYKGDYIICNVWAFRHRKGIFDKYLETYMKMKENATSKFERQNAKDYMNHLYGKFGMNSKRLSKVVEFKDGNIVYKNIENTTPRHPKEIASRITSNAKLILMECAEKNSDSFVYCDTDSFYSTKELKNINIDDKKIGYWALESINVRFKALKAKCYMREEESGEIVHKICGMPEECKKLVTFENFEKNLQIKDKKLQNKLVKGGIILTHTHFTIKIDDMF